MVCFRRGYAHSVRFHCPRDNGLFERVFDELCFARCIAQNQAGLVFARAGLPAFVLRQTHYGRPLRAPYKRHAGGADNPAFVRLRDDSPARAGYRRALVFGVYVLTKGEIVFLLVFIAAVPFCIIPVQMMRRNLKRCAKMSAESLGAIAQCFNENLAAAQEVRVFNLQESQKRKFWDMNVSFQSLALKITKYELLQQPLMEVLAAAMVSVTFVYAYQVKIDFSTFAAIGLALYFTIDPIKRIIRMATDFIKISPSFDRLNEILDYVYTVPEAKNPIPIKVLRGKINFENVNFAYTDRPVLNNVTIEISSGTSCALAGESGAGKSTFAKLVMRFYDPNSGSISIDGINLKDISLFDLHKNLGFVPQYPVLFNDTIYNNILLARPEATKAEVYAAAKAARRHTEPGH